MSARKLIRNMFRIEGARRGVKPSRYVANRFNRYQVEKYGEIVRRINQAKSTHKRATWKNRIASVV